MTKAWIDFLIVLCYGKRKMIKEVSLAVNSKVHSDFGQAQGLFYSLFPLDYRNLPEEAEIINIKGAEPFLREDLYRIVRVISFRCPKAEIVIETTGFSPCVIKKQAEKILQFKRDIGLKILLDGFGRKHDEINGFKAGYALVLETIRVLKELGLKRIEISFGLLDKNISHLKKVYRLSRELGLGFDVYLKAELKQKSRARKELVWLMSQEIKGFSRTRWENAYFIYGLIKILRDNERILPDYSGLSSLFIDSFGRIYPSAAWHLEMGILAKITSWSLFYKRVEKLISENERPMNWVKSAVQPAMEKQWIKVSWWIFKRKFLHFEHFRRMASLLSPHFFQAEKS